METTRHFTATTYVVVDGATALHRHKRMDKWLPPGGHVDRGELPHEAALREVREETGLDPTLVADRDEITSQTVSPLPKPQHLQLADVNVYEPPVTADGEEKAEPRTAEHRAVEQRTVGHQHVDMVYYAAAESRAIDPADGEEPADAWAWFTADDLATDDEIDADVAETGRRAIETVVARQEGG